MKLPEKENYTLTNIGGPQSCSSLVGNDIRFWSDGAGWKQVIRYHDL